jgi:hypothetical protein
MYAFALTHSGAEMYFFGNSYYSNWLLLVHSIRYCRYFNIGIWHNAQSKHCIIQISPPSTLC